MMLGNRPLAGSDPAASALVRSASVSVPGRRRTQTVARLPQRTRTTATTMYRR